jgi:choline dehydrogenase-like flavoprotein
MRTAVLFASLAPLAALALPVTSPADVLWQRASSSVTSDGSALQGRSFDYVVVGCGLGGMVTAARLSEDGASVLCIEAGDDIRNDPDVTNVARYSDVVGSSKNWKYQTVAQPQANGRQLQVSAGRGLGGSTSINGGALTRSAAGQLDALQELGNDGWNWDSVLEAMKKSEKFHAPDSSQASAGAAWNSSVHGVDGPLDISFPDTMYRGAPPKKFVAAVTSALGVELVNDLGNGEQPAVAWTPNTIKPYSGDAQTRVSSATAYLSPIEYDRENLVVLTGHRAAAIAWASDSGDVKRAESVSILSSADAEPFSVTVTKEVVLAAGAIRTPLLLEASGVGDSSVLSKIG